MWYIADVPMQKKWPRFGDYLKHWREQAGITQPALAKATGTSKQNISNLERGQPHPVTGAIATPSVQLAVKLAKSLGRPIEEFLTEAGLIDDWDKEEISEAVKPHKAQSARRGAGEYSHLFDGFSEEFAALSDTDREIYGEMILQVRENIRKRKRRK